MNKKNSDSTYEKADIFNFYINKTIMLSAKYYYKRKMNKNQYENDVDMVDFTDEEDMKENFTEFMDFQVKENTFINECENEELLKAITKLSAIEQSVIFLSFSKELSRSEAAKILNVCEDTISRAKLRAIEKLKKYLKGADDNE